MKPFVKWVGGKRKLITEITANMPKEFNKYIEPFVGGGAVAIEMLGYNVPIYINDINVDLINAYKVIKENVEELILELDSMCVEGADFYYKKRDEYNSGKIDDVNKAALFMYLNKTCFNGLYRVNKDNCFNVPYGKMSFSYDANELREFSVGIKDVNICCMDFEDMYKYIEKDSFVYFDSPYKPISKTSNFDKYTKSGFDNDHERLYNMFVKCSAKGAKLMLSNSNNEEIKELYKNYNIKEVYAGRSINSKGSKRGKIKELLITNY